jgi:hypothetical protein
MLDGPMNDLQQGTYQASEKGSCARALILKEFSIQFGPVSNREGSIVGRIYSSINFTISTACLYEGENVKVRVRWNDIAIYRRPQGMFSRDTKYIQGHVVKTNFCVGSTPSDRGKSPLNVPPFSIRYNVNDRTAVDLSGVHEVVDEADDGYATEHSDSCDSCQHFLSFPSSIRGMHTPVHHLRIYLREQREEADDRREELVQQSNDVDRHGPASK